MSSVYVAILVLDEALVVVSDVVGAGIIAVVGSDVAVAMRGSRGWNWGLVDELGAMGWCWRYFGPSLGVLG